MRWLILLAFIAAAFIFLRGVYLVMLRDPTMAWLTRRLKRAGRPRR